MPEPMASRRKAVMGHDGEATTGDFQATYAFDNKLRYEFEATVHTSNYRLSIVSLAAGDDRRIEVPLKSIYNIKPFAGPGSGLGGPGSGGGGDDGDAAFEFVCKDGLRFRLRGSGPHKERFAGEIDRVRTVCHDSADYFAFHMRDEHLRALELVCSCPDGGGGANDRSVSCHPVKVLFHDLSAGSRAADVSVDNAPVSPSSVCGNGWHVYDAAREMRRMFRAHPHLIGGEAPRWKLVSIGDICPTYDAVIVPGDAKIDTLKQVAKFRTKSRLPILSWFHPTRHSTLARSSQPCTGFTNKQNEHDVAYLKRFIGGGAGRDGGVLAIYDARPMVNAKANVLNGGGDSSGYDKRHFKQFYMHIENIHRVRESMKKVWELVWHHLDSESYFEKLEKTDWLAHLRTILTGAVKIVVDMDRNRDVLVHCSDGWDRTAQLTSLAMLMQDSYYRTIVGFEVLIEKEWCSVGHKFADRLGHRHADEKERSPIFLQFLDCVHQLQLQCPTAFEFTDDLLLFIARHSTSCLFGTFLANSARERVECGATSTSCSLWTYVNAYRGDFANPEYAPVHAGIVPMVSARRLRLWRSFFGAWHPLSLRCEDLPLRRAELNEARVALDSTTAGFRRDVTGGLRHARRPAHQHQEILGE